MSQDLHKWFPSALGSIGLFDQVIYALQRIFDDTETGAEDSWQKFVNFPSNPTDLVSALVAEFGFQDIVDVLQITQENLTNLFGTIGLIQAMKGSTQGLLFVLAVLGFSGSTIQEWWEQSPEGTPYTFILSLNINTRTLESGDLQRILTFIRNYVYGIPSAVNLVGEVVQANIFSAGAVDQTYSCSFSN